MQKQMRAIPTLAQSLRKQAEDAIDILTKETPNPMDYIYEREDMVNGSAEPTNRTHDKT